MNGSAEKKGMGWLPDHPDIRDFTADHDEVKKIKNGKTEQSDPLSINPDPPQSYDLREWCSPVEDQGPLGSCSAHAGIALVEYFIRKASGRNLDVSRLFMYKVTRNLSHIEGDSGAQMRTTIGAMTLFGVPPEEYWPYEITNYDNEPPAFCYQFAESFRAINYFRLDPPNTTPEFRLNLIKDYISKGFPSIFGFTAYSCMDQAKTPTASGMIPFPDISDVAIGGHAVMAVGYDNNIEILNSKSKNTFKGAFLIRNSWGVEWGIDGYGWLPYEYLTRRLARDWWTVIKQDWVDTGKFGF